MTQPNFPMVRNSLDGIAYPCVRADLLRHAAAQGAGDDTLGALNGLPDRQYRSAEDVCGSLCDLTSGHR